VEGMEGMRINNVYKKGVMLFMFKVFQLKAMIHEPRDGYI
jgi:hypothetical protein